MGLFNFFTQEIAMDLGTANTLIIHNDEVVVNEPSIIALNRNNMKEVLGVGKKALLMPRLEPDLRRMMDGLQRALDPKTGTMPWPKGRREHLLKLALT